MDRAGVRHDLGKTYTDALLYGVIVGDLLPESGSPAFRLGKVRRYAGCGTAASRVRVRRIIMSSHQQAPRRKTWSVPDF